MIPKSRLGLPFNRRVQNRGCLISLHPVFEEISQRMLCILIYSWRILYSCASLLGGTALFRPLREIKEDQNHIKMTSKMFRYP